MRATIKMSASSASALFAAAVLLAGCAVGPDYHNPSVSLPATFAHAPEVASRATAQPGPSLSTWWQGFADPEMNRVIDIALAQNLDLAQAMARVSEVRAGLESARSALLPSAEFDAQAARAHLSLEDPNVAAQAASLPGYNRNSYDYSVTAGATWEIDLAGGLRRSAEAARADYEGSQAAMVAARLEVISSAADTYVLTRTLQARLQLAQQETATQQDRVRLVGLLAARGLAPDFQLQQAKGALAAVSASMPALQAGLVSARNALDVLMGRNPGTPDPALDSAAPIPGAPAINTATGPAELLRRRPDIVVAERRLAASNARIGEALSDYYPKFSLSALAGSTTTVGGHLFESPANEALGVFGLRWRLFDFGRVDAEVKAARGRNAEALAAYRQSVLQASADVENAFSALAKYDQQQQILKDGENSLAQARASTSAGYRNGRNSQLDLVEADAQLQRIQEARILAQSATARSAIASFKALGGGWDADPATAPQTVVSN
ncbi:TolC family protein [Paraburkholderia sp. BCC1876]|uniref:efflux transporter outer membrane subunit n=1 Tax=Paraburkholderia sp. BCC1876 TaxID=2676303 RepID=UPI001FC7C4A6|nr:TolC family protein [Paraburkholderia sp. BCC1876]